MEEAAYATPIVAASALYAAALLLVLTWYGWSVKRHGLRRRSLRRYSYILFATFLVARATWCALLIDAVVGRAADDPAAIERRLRAPVPRALHVLSGCLEFAVLSLIVLGWVDSTYLMMTRRSLQPVAIRPSVIFHRLGPLFLLANALVVGISATPLLPLVISPDDDGVALAVQTTGDGVAAVTSLVLALGSLGAGLWVSSRIRTIAEAEPTLRSYAHTKARKVLLAAAVFFVSLLARALVFLENAFHLRILEDSVLSKPAAYLALGVVLPDLLPTFAALLVLRKRVECTPPCCSGFYDRGRRGIYGGVDQTPLYGAEAHSASYEGL